MTSEHIQQSIDKAVRGESNLTQEILNIRGFSTDTIRRLFSNLCNTDFLINYLEVGLFCGASFCSSFNKNCISIGIENHSQDFSEGFDKVKQELKNNIDKFSSRAKEVHVHYADCFEMDKSLVPNDIDIIFYDGKHDYDCQAAALPCFFDKMAKTFLLIVDDWAWKPVFEGTNAGLHELKEQIEIVYHQPLRGYSLENDPVWHNSIALFLINKK